MVILSFVLLLMIVLSVPRLMINRQSALAEFEDSKQINMSLTAYALTNAVWNYDYVSAESIAKGVLLDPKVYGISLLNLDGEEIFHLDKGEAYSPKRFLETSHQIVAFRNIDIAQLNITYTHYYIYETLNKQLLWEIISSLMILFFLERLIEYISKHVSKPIVDLKNHAIKITEGHWDEEIRVSSRDEIGELAKAFSKMLESLKRSMDERDDALMELEEMNGILEERVQERTEELFAANQDLKSMNMELEKTLQELYRTQDKLVETEKYQVLSQFILNLAHDMNTPIGLILSSASYVSENNKKLIEHHEKTEKTGHVGVENILYNNEKALAIIQDSLHKTIQLIEQFKRIEIKTDSQEKECIELRAYFENFTKKMHSYYKKKHVTFSVEGDEHTCVFLAKEALRKTLDELVKNAAKHGLEANELLQIKISYKVQDEELCIEVSDNGKGMSEEVKAVAFKPYFALNAMEMKKKPLGLYIVYNIVTFQMNGKIEFEKGDESKGTRVVIRLPLLESKEQCEEGL